MLSARSGSNLNGISLVLFTRFSGILLSLSVVAPGKDHMVFFVLVSLGLEIDTALYGPRPEAADRCPFDVYLGQTKTKSREAYQQQSELLCIK